MTSEPADLDYRALVSRAILMIPREALTIVAEHGLSADHAIHLSFRPGAPGAIVPEFLRDRPELTVVLDQQFWDLAVDDDGWSVDLRFGGQSYRVGSPWSALTAFYDPPAKFALRFNAEPVEALPEEPAAERPGEVVSFDAWRRGG